MKAVILAGGRGSRMGALTDSIPKPLISVCDKPLILHTLEALPRVVEEIFIVVGYKKDAIRSFIQQNFSERKIRFIEQENSGTGGALLSAKYELTETEKFFVVGSDDVFGQGELDKLVNHQFATYGIYKTIADKPTVGIQFDSNGRLTARVAVAEGDIWHHGVGAYCLPPEIFNSKFKRLPNGEYSIPHTLPHCSFPVHVQPIEHWLPVNTPDEIALAEKTYTSWLRPG